MIEARQQLADDDAAAVAALVGVATEVDRVAPLNEQGMRRLHGGGPVDHLLARAAHRIVGYAQLDPTGGTAELVVHPHARQRGIGRALVSRIVSAAPEVKVWAHGDLPAAAALAQVTGFQQLRSLWQMGRGLTGDLPRARIPDGITVDTFEPGTDDDAWLALNARAFAEHPEQGAWTRADLHDRFTEAWFDPAGFFVARRATGMVGFHWTKLHDNKTGEIYVLGVDPAEQGGGLGRALTLVGLHHLADTGRARVILYVDESNRGAVRLYRGLGFERIGLDVMYARRRS